MARLRVFIWTDVKIKKKNGQVGVVDDIHVGDKVHIEFKDLDNASLIEIIGKTKKKKKKKMMKHPKKMSPRKKKRRIKSPQTKKMKRKPSRTPKQKMMGGGK